MTISVGHGKGKASQLQTSPSSHVFCFTGYKLRKTDPESSNYLRYRRGNVLPDCDCFCPPFWKRDAADNLSRTRNVNDFWQWKQSYTKAQRNTAKRRQRRKKSSNNIVSFQTTSGEKYIKNLSNKKITDSQIKLISHGLKFIPVNKLNENRIRRQLLQDFETFARRMRLKYMFYRHNRNVHPFYVKSNWNPPVQKSVALENYLEEVKLQLTEIQITKPKQNLSRDEQKALNELKQNSDINLKKADKGSTTVFMNKTDKIKEGENLLNDEQSYKRLTEPMVKGTHNKVLHLIADLHRENHIDDMTKKWLWQAPNPPRIQEFCTLTKIHKPTITARPIISGCDGGKCVCIVFRCVD